LLFPPVDCGRETTTPHSGSKVVSLPVDGVWGGVIMPGQKANKKALFFAGDILKGKKK